MPREGRLMARKSSPSSSSRSPAGQANPAPPVGPALGQHGVNIMEFCKTFNAQTQDAGGTIIPVEITVFEDRSFTFITKTPPAAILIKEAAGVEKGSGEPHREKVGSITRDQARQIAETKLPDLNACDLDQATKIIEGTARSMGVEVAARGWPTASDTETSTRAWTASAPTRRPRRSACEGDAVRASSPRASSATCAPGSTSATPTSSSAARSRFRTAWGRTSRSPSSPRVTGPARPRRRAPTTWVTTTSRSVSRTASPTSTWRSRRRT